MIGIFSPISCLLLLQIFSFFCRWTEMSVKSKKLSNSESITYYLPEETASLPWAQWSDTELNREKWTSPKNGADGLFLDPQPVPMPSSLEPYEWIRAKNLKHLSKPLTIFLSTAERPDLVTNNKHLLHSKFVRWFISAVTNLQYCGYEGLDVSGKDPNFFWNYRDLPWQGWMHVYSMNSAGRGAQHRPVINPNSKYIIRLYFMGCWRRVAVDDMIPVDKGGKPLLPCTANDYELWPMLLAKALLKLASLSWTGKREIVDFHPVTCLTGWVCLTLNVMHLSPQDKWDLLMKYTERFQWTPEMLERETVEDTADTDAKEFEENPKKSKMLEKLRPVTLFLDLVDMREISPETVPGLSPCWDHCVYVVQSRDITLDPTSVKAPLEKWKFHRWLKWAIDRGLINSADYFIPIRFLKLISPLKEEIEDIGFWTDFNKLTSFIKNVHFFYKIEHFQYSIQISDMWNTKVRRDQKDDIDSITERRKGSPPRTTITQETNFPNTYNWPKKTSQSKNEALYLFCDSAEKKFFLISFSVVQESSTSPLETDTSTSKNYFILEKHSWFFEPAHSEPLISLATTGTKSTILELGSGRHLLQMYCHSVSYCLISLSSDCVFHVGDQLTIHRLMSTESDRIDLIVKRISNSIIKAYQAFGTADYKTALRIYYQSYLPIVENADNRRRSLFNRIHKYFMEEQVKLIKNFFPAAEAREILYSLKVFFLNPAFDVYRPDRISLFRRSFCEETRKISKAGTYNKDLMSECNRAATIIQSFLKMVIIKQYKYIHNPDHKKHEEIRRNISKVTELFDCANRESLAHQLFRNLIKRDERLRELYPCTEDFQYVLQIQECKGILMNSKSDQWLPIIRLLVNTQESETVFAVINLFIDLPRHTLRVFNNETSRELFRIINNVAPAHYRFSKMGYTIFGYGWNETQKFKELDWSMHIVTMKGEPLFYQLDNQKPLAPRTVMPSLVIKELSNVYVPNVNNYIAKGIIRINSTSVISLRLEISYNSAQTKLNVLDENGTVLYTANGGAVLVLPFVYLEHKKTASNETESYEKTETKYYVEALVLNDSWPLTEAEWETVKEAKVKDTISKAKVRQSSVSGNKVLKLESQRMKRISKSSVDSNQSHSPYWILQVVIDATTMVEISEDRRRKEEIKSIIESWSAEDPGKSQRGKTLREAFMDEHALVITAPHQSEQRVSITADSQSAMKKDSDLASAISLPHADETRTLKRPHSYRYLPSIDLPIFTDEQNVQEGHGVKEMPRERRALDDFQKDYSKFLEDMTKLTDNQRRRHGRLFDRYKSNFWKRRNLVEETFEARKLYVGDVKSVKSSNTIKDSKQRKKVKD